MPSIKPVGNEDETTRAYLDEIGKIPRIDHRKEQEHGLAIERREHIRKQRTRHRKPQDCNFTDSILRYINGSAPTISGLFRHAGLDPNPHMAEVAHNPNFRALIDWALTEPVTEVARRWSGITDTDRLSRHLRRLSLNTACLTDAAIHLTDNCRLSRLEQHLNDPDYPIRRNVMARHLSDQLDKLVAAGDQHEEALASANLRLVVSVARDYAGYNIPMIDLIQEGNIGLLVSAQRYNHRMGTKFSTYATWWIRHHILQCLNKQSRSIRLPEHKIKLISKISAARRALTQELGRQPTDTETAGYLELDTPTIENADLIRQQPSNLDEPISEDGETLLQHTIPSAGPSVDEEVARRSLTDIIRQALDKLSDKESQVLTLRYGLADDTPLTVTAIAKDLGITNSQVRETEQKALTRLQTVPELRNMLADFAV